MLKVIAVKGSMIVVVDEKGRELTRDASRFKRCTTPLLSKASPEEAYEPNDNSGSTENNGSNITHATEHGDYVIVETAPNLINEVPTDLIPPTDQTPGISAPARPGRPKGSKNKPTRETIDLPTSAATDRYPRRDRQQPVRYESKPGRH